ncbi:MAG: Ig-like domain-containing protein [bacterium]
MSVDGETLQMAATVSPSNATLKSVTWSVSNPAVASISVDGVLTAINNGKVDVIATATDGSGIRGKVSITISNQKQHAGLHSYEWNAKNEQGIEVPNGVCFYQLRCEDKILTKKMLLMR